MVDEPRRIVGAKLAAKAALREGGDEGDHFGIERRVRIKADAVHLRRGFRTVVGRFRA
jgi:hypothetical protein